eukprot:CAMPEP_0196702386 /NCGR_PEP_ID=MMETSP1090-20130531/53556_1 /TAXON_ID=37098 /ORGANISM="Isochrysis sp, Strain CCMP1244" /LENGTH=207 /DNA_ID=CAMNT_0042042201 /DNA_START=149 /DNA_END=772 /DNA_ORIENTATION=-
MTIGASGGSPLGGVRRGAATADAAGRAEELGRAEAEELGRAEAEEELGRAAHCARPPNTARPRGAASPPACALIGRVRATRRCAARISERLRSVSMASRSKSAGCSPVRTRTSRATGMAASRPTASGSSSNRLPLPGRLAEAGVGGLGVDAALPPAAARLSSRLAFRRDTMASASSHCCCSSRPEYCAACSSCLNIADSRLESSSCA